MGDKDKGYPIATGEVKKKGSEGAIATGFVQGQKKESVLATGGLVAGKMQNAVSSKDETLSAAVTVGAVVATGAKAAQAASPAAIGVGKGIVSVGKGAWDVTTTAGKATVTVVKATKIMTGGFVPINGESIKTALVTGAQMTGLANTATSQRIIGGVTQIQSRVEQMRIAAVNVTKGMKTGVVVTANAAKTTYAIVRGVANGSMMASAVAHQALAKLGEHATTAGLKGIKLVGRGMVKSGGVIYKTAASAAPKAVKGAGNMTMGVAGVLASSDDMMLQGVGNTVMISRYGIKTSVAAGRMTGRTLKTAVEGTAKTAKTTYRAAKFIHQKGLRAAWAKARNKAATATARAGQSVASAIVNVLKLAGKKVVVPLILVVAVVVIILNLLTAPVSAVGSIFGGSYSQDNGDGTFSEIDIRTFIIDPDTGAPAKQGEFADDLYGDMEGSRRSNGGDIDEIRFNGVHGSAVNPNDEQIKNLLYTETDMANIIQPIFNAVILKDYELTLTWEQSQKALKDIMDMLLGYDEEIITETCGSAHSCGSIHAGADCLNPVSGSHGSFVCGTCCYRTHSTDCTSASCSGCADACRGYTYCDIHNIRIITIRADGLNRLLEEYFIKPIAELEGNADKTPDEMRELSILKDTYEICLEYLGMSNIMGGSDGVVGDFLWPVPGYTYVSSPFGYRIHPVYGDVRYHTGIDIPAPAGTPIIAVADGKVTIAHTSDDNAYGIHVKIKHDNGFESFYAHCTLLAVTSGRTVRAGDVIAFVGTTGVSTGNHLHFEIWKNGTRIDPQG